MNAMERLKAARELAAKFVSLVDQDDQGIAWVEAVGRLGTELHGATEFFLLFASKAAPGPTAQGRLIEIGEAKDGASPIACFQLLSRADAMAISGMLYTPVVIELRKDEQFR